METPNFATFSPLKNGEESPIWDGEKATAPLGPNLLDCRTPSESLEALPGSRRHRSACTAAAPTRLGTHPAGTAHKPVRRQKAGWCLGKPDPPPNFATKWVGQGIYRGFTLVIPISKGNCRGWWEFMS